MRNQLLHIFRNTPQGREVFLQSIYFSKQVNTFPKVFIPTDRQFCMYLQTTVVTVDLDGSFFYSPGTAQKHAAALLKNAGFEPDFLRPDTFTADKIPNIPVDFRFMSCPRSISDLSTKIGLGHIGPKVRSIVEKSAFPVLLPSPVFKEWKSITVFFDGSANAIKAVQIGIKLAQVTGFPLRLVTQMEKYSEDDYKEILDKKDISLQVNGKQIDWRFFKKGTLEENLYEVPHDSLAVVGTTGQGLVKKLLFGTKAEKLQTTLTNNLLLVGPNNAPFPEPFK